MSLTNEKKFDIYEYKPKQIDEIINKKHKEYMDVEKKLKNSCPSCNSKNYNFAFDKYNFHYVQCQNCLSLYIQNPITEDDFFKYEDYLKKNLYDTDEYSSYLELLMNKISFELELTFSRLLDKKQKLNVAYLGNKSKVYEYSLESFDVEFIHIDLFDNLEENKYDLIILDHIVEKLNHLDGFMKKINTSLNNNGLLYVTIRVGSGIDILTLWEDSKVYPIEHTNLLSIDGIKKLFNRTDFKIKELNTPGVLDIDNIIKTKSKNIPKFLCYLEKLQSADSIEEFQSFVQKNLLSSFATIIAKRK